MRRKKYQINSVMTFGLRKLINVIDGIDDFYVEVLQLSILKLTVNIDLSFLADTLLFMSMYKVNTSRQMI